MSAPDRNVVNLVRTMHAPLAREVHLLRLWLGELEGKLDHIHADLVALREVAMVPRPECYPHADEEETSERDAGD